MAQTQPKFAVGDEVVLNNKARNHVWAKGFVPPNTVTNVEWWPDVPPDGGWVLTLREKHEKLWEGFTMNGSGPW